MDSFAHGTVIRWVMFEKYTYTAMKAGSSWYTSAVKSTANSVSSVPQVVGTDDLFKMLSDPDATNVEIATAWEEVPV